MESPLGIILYTYDAANQLLQAGDETFTYDQLGRQIGKTDVRGTTHYTYARDHRLIRLSPPGDTAWNFDYDPFGRRISAESPDGIRCFAYAGWDVIAERGEDGHWDTTYAYGNEKLTMRHRQGTGIAATTYHGDGLGNVAVLAHDQGMPRVSYHTDPFGVQRRAAGGDPNPYRFVGRAGVRAEAAVHDVYLMGQRYYDAHIGRFLTPDPLIGNVAYPVGHNAYVYADNNPLTLADPFGLQAGPKSPVANKPQKKLCWQQPLEEAGLPTTGTREQQIQRLHNHVRDKNKYREVIVTDPNAPGALPQKLPDGTVPVFTNPRTGEPMHTGTVHNGEVTNIQVGKEKEQHNSIQELLNFQKNRKNAPTDPWQGPLHLYIPITPGSSPATPATTH